MDQGWKGGIGCDVRGMTALEVLIAASMISVALLAIASMLPTSHANVDHAGRISKATALAQQMLESIKNDTYNQVVLYNGVDTRNPATYPVDDLASVPQFRGGTNVQRWANDIQEAGVTSVRLSGGSGTIAVTTPTAGLRLVTVQVFWTERGAQESVLLQTLIAQ